MKKKHKIFYPLIFLFFLTSCVEEISNEQIDPNLSELSQLNFPDNFNYETTETIDVDVSVKGTNGEALSTVKVSFYTDSPENGGRLLSTLLTDENGIVNSKILVPAYLDELFVEVNSVGIANQMKKPINPSMSFDFGGISSSQRPFVDTKSSFTPVPISGNYYYMGPFQPGLDDGLPLYLDTPDVVTQDFLNDVSAALPSGLSVPINNPQYLTTTNELDVVVNQQSEVWVTFIGETAGFRNSLGYYVHDTANPPANVNQIDSIFVVLPNASLKNSRGELEVGDKVNLGVFDGGKTISWVLFRNGWNGTDVNVNTVKYYSRIDFNTSESDPTKRQHTVQLIDYANQLLLNGFEDQNRTSGFSDEDFNDLLFYVSANPWDGIDDSDILPTGNCPDTDGDGLDDCQDEFPDDPERATRNTYEGSLAYEDLWPSAGDYDFNDMVVDYEIDHILNASNDLVDIEADWTVKAVGAGYKNGFGVEFDGILPSAIASVSGQNLQENIVSNNSNGTENGSTNATVIFFENVFNIIQASSGSFINTLPANPYTTPVTLNTVINFVTPVDESVVGFPPYDAFIFANATRGREIHLPGQDPTNLADGSLFNFAADATDPANNYYYKTENGLPWAINIAEPFDYPIEYIPINEAYLNFVQWAESGGTLNADWFLDIPGNRDVSKIYD